MARRPIRPRLADEAITEAVRGVAARLDQLLSKEPGFPDVDVRPIKGARKFVTIDRSNWPAKVEGHGLGQNVDRESFRGAFVRLVPVDVEATDDEIESFALWLAQVAQKVVVERRRRAAVVVQVRERQPHKKAREVVVGLVEEANVGDRQALRDLCEAAMAKAGL